LVNSEGFSSRTGFRIHLTGLYIESTSDRLRSSDSSFAFFNYQDSLFVYEDLDFELSDTNSEFRSDADRRQTAASSLPALNPSTIQTKIRDRYRKLYVESALARLLRHVHGPLPDTEIEST
jgi:hypothetical protein